MPKRRRYHKAAPLQNRLYLQAWPSWPVQVRAKEKRYSFYTSYQIYLQEVQAKLLSQRCPGFLGTSQPGIKVCTCAFFPSLGIVKFTVVD